VRGSSLSAALTPACTGTVRAVDRELGGSPESGFGRRDHGALLLTHKIASSKRDRGAVCASYRALDEHLLASVWNDNLKLAQAAVARGVDQHEMPADAIQGQKANVPPQ